MTSVSDLTDKQQAFISEYLKDWNATQAAIRAGYSEKTARQIGTENLAKPVIASAIRARVNENAMTANEVLWHLADIARGDIGNVASISGSITDLSSARENGMTKLIRKVRFRTFTNDDGETHEVEVEMYDRLKALDMLAKYHDLTNKVRVEDWRSQAIADIQSGNIDYFALSEAFGEDLATELFRTAGVPIEAQ